MPESSHTSELPYDISDEYRLEPESEPQPPAWQDGSVRIGIHASIAGDLTNALESARKLGCNALQIFSASPRMWPRPGSRIAEADAARFRARREALSLGPLVIHANYLINLATPDAIMHARAIQAFHDEIVRALALGADFLWCILGRHAAQRWRRRLRASGKACGTRCADCVRGICAS